MSKRKNSGGWICVHRKIQENWLWKDLPACRGRAWIDLLLWANHADREVLFDGRPKLIKHGELLTSERRLTDQWKWSRGKVKRFLTGLQTAQQIVQQTDRRGTIISIVNYDGMQREIGDGGTTDSTTDGTAGETSDGPLAGPQTDTNNNGNNKNNGNKKTKRARARGSSGPKVDPKTFPMPEPLDTATGRAALAEWLEYKSEIGDCYKSQKSVTTLLGKWARHGDRVFRDAVENSIGNGWKGLFEPKNFSANGSNGNGRRLNKSETAIANLAKAAGGEIELN